VKRYYDFDSSPSFVAAGIQDSQQLAGFVSPQLYQPASPFEFGEKCGGLWSYCSAHAIAAESRDLGTSTPTASPLFYGMV